ncbi:MAG TPA: hypothetical protein VF025_14685 [Gaiellaceae bacterium]
MPTPHDDARPRSSSHGAARVHPTLGRGGAVAQRRIPKADEHPALGPALFGRADPSETDRGRTSGCRQRAFRREPALDVRRRLRSDCQERIRLAAEQEEQRLYLQRASREYLDAIAPIGTDWIKPHITEAPYLIVVFEQAWSLEDGEKRRRYYVRESVGIAVGFLKEILERPDGERPFLLLPVGYPTTDAEVPVLEKKPLAEIAQFV